MNHLFFVAVATGIFSGTSISVKAQTNVNIETLIVSASHKPSLKFIEGIELKPEATVALVSVAAPELGTSPSIKAISAKKLFGAKSIEECGVLQFKYALLMERDVESFSNASLYNFIEDWWGTRYRYGGVDRKGIDCSAFTGKLLADVYGITAPRIAKDQYDVCKKISIEELVEGDLVFFNTRGGVSHVGFYLGDNHFVHSSVHSGVTISSLTDEYYSKKFIGGGRLN